MTDFLFWGLAIGLTVLVYGVVLLLIAAFQEHVNHMEQGYGHIGGVGLHISDRNLWITDCLSQVSALGQRIRSAVAQVRTSKRTVYVDQLYAEYHPRIDSMRRLLK